MVMAETRERVAPRVDVDPARTVVAVPDFDAMYDTHVDAVSRCVVALGVASSSVDDAVQDVFVVAYRRLGDFEGRSTVRTWLLGIALRVAHDYRRTVKRKGGAGELSDDLVDVSPLPDEQAARRQALELTTRILSELDEARRTVFVLAEIEGLTAPEIAEMLAIPVNTVYSRLRLAREDFETLLSRSRRTARRP
jgi:RNA polymerase sigma-70 factor (ECF subfamily)